MRISVIPLISLLVHAEDTVDEKDVVVLTDKTFGKFIQDEPVTLVEFYAPWCGHCKSLKPHYAKAATLLASEKIKIAKVDCTVEKQACESQKVQGFPTLKIFKKGKMINLMYRGRSRI